MVFICEFIDALRFHTEFGFMKGEIGNPCTECMYLVTEFNFRTVEGSISILTKPQGNGGDCNLCKVSGALIC